MPVLDIVVIHLQDRGKGMGLAGKDEAFCNFSIRKDLIFFHLGLPFGNPCDTGAADTSLTGIWGIYILFENGIQDLHPPIH